MYKFYEFLPEIKPLSMDLIKDVYWSIENCQNIFYDTNHAWYQIFMVHPRLIEFTSSIFDFPHNTNVQTIKKGLPVHIDFGRVYAYNFIIETGGSNVKTCFYDRNDFYYDENKKLRSKNTYAAIEEIRIPSMHWHKINVSVPHNVINIEQLRISLTVTENKNFTNSREKYDI